MGQLAIEKERLRLRKNKLAQQEQKTEQTTVEQAIDAQPTLTPILPFYILPFGS